MTCMDVERYKNMEEIRKKVTESNTHTIYYTDRDNLGLKYESRFSSPGYDLPLPDAGTYVIQVTQSALDQGRHFIHIFCVLQRFFFCIQVLTLVVKLLL